MGVGCRGSGGGEAKGSEGAVWSSNEGQRSRNRQGTPESLHSVRTCSPSTAGYKENNIIHSSVRCSDEKWAGGVVVVVVAAARGCAMGGGGGGVDPNGVEAGRGGGGMGKADEDGEVDIHRRPVGPPAAPVDNVVEWESESRAEPRPARSEAAAAEEEEASGGTVVAGIPVGGDDEGGRVPPLGLQREDGETRWVAITAATAATPSLASRRSTSRSPSNRPLLPPPLLPIGCASSSSSFSSSKSPSPPSQSSPKVKSSCHNEERRREGRVVVVVLVRVARRPPSRGDGEGEGKDATAGRCNCRCRKDMEGGGGGSTTAERVPPPPRVCVFRHRVM